MPNVFFVSYARPRQGQPAAVQALDAFIGDLREAVGQQLAGADFKQVGFRDTCNLDAGTPDWSADLAQQMAAYPVGLVLLSPAYLETGRAWCKWECDYLAQRNAAAAALPDKVAPQKPRLLLVLDWVRPDPRDLPEGFPALTQGVGESIAGLDPQDVAATRLILQRGLQDSLQLVQAGDTVVGTAYQRFVQALSRHIVGQYRLWQDLDARGIDLGLPPPFVASETWRLPPPFVASETWRLPARAAGRPPASPRQKVYVVFLAAHPDEVTPISHERAKRYQDDGESDWQPFATAGQAGPRVGEVVKKLEHAGISTVVGLPFHYFQGSMPKMLEIEKAGTRYPIVLVVDPWSAARLPQYGKALKKFSEEDRKRVLFALPVEVPNAEDPEEALIRADFAASVGKLFHPSRWQRHAGADELAEGLSLGVKLMQLNIRNARADSLPASGSAPPRISAS